MNNFKTVFHVTCVMHNCRVNERMKRYKVKTGIPVKLTLEQEIILTNIIYKIIKESNYIILAFNICYDHIHFVIICDYEELIPIVQTIKSISSREFRKKVNISSVLWAEKFNRKTIEDEKQIMDTINYVNFNREKHEFPKNEDLENAIIKMLTPYEKTFE